MVLDISAIIAILAHEPEAARIGRVLSIAPLIIISAATLVEATIVARYRFGDDGVRDLDLLLAKLRAEIIVVTVQQAELARRAHQRYGKGQHPAGLNFGDCFVYALARERDEPLLFRGADLARTDIVAVPY